MKYIGEIRQPRLAPTQTIAIGFATIILIGGLLLSLPQFTNGKGGISLINGLFTSASATCVTGLVPLDTYTTYNFAGQLLILILLQIGGLSFISIGLGIPIILGSKIGISSRVLLAESLGAHHLGGIVKGLKRILKGTALIEGVGAFILSLVFVPKFGLAKGVWFGIFHSISAFCNGGFDLMGSLEPGSSLTLYNSNPVVILTISALIVVGGIGFILWLDIWEKGFKWRKYSLHTKIMLSFTSGLILIGTAFFYFSEADASMAGMSHGTRLINSLFCSISPRTAGFNSVDYGQMSHGGRFITMILMFIGAGSGSTGGGIKVTTFATLILAVYSYSKNYRDLSIFQRRLTAEAQRKAFSVYASFIALIVSCTLVLVIDNPSMALEGLLFESISAIGTVGLTLGVTPSLGAISKTAIICLMYLGRLGSLSVAIAIIRRLVIPRMSYPEEKISIG